MMGRELRYSYGRQTSCATCGSDVEFHGNRRWVDRGGNTHCDTSGAARWDENGVLVPFPHRRHAPIPARLQ